MEKQVKPKLTYQLVALILGLVITLSVFAYGIISASSGTPQTCKQAVENKMVNAVQDECIRSFAKQLDRIERKLDDYAKRNGHSK